MVTSSRPARMVVHHSTATLSPESPVGADPLRRHVRLPERMGPIDGVLGEERCRGLGLPLLPRAAIGLDPLLARHESAYPNTKPAAAAAATQRLTSANA